ncbi:MAG TPA: hypothetical protein VFU47_16245 [Armatimonadota bacterium]|nr:hypothetical protein [Armatimonadota bacterium]
MTYERKRNEANGEENRDGENHNLSRNYGVEGPTDDPEILRVRERQVRNFLATLYLSQGVPMLSAGDTIGRTQRGNNNAYCQDNEISWLDWKLDDRGKELLAFARRLAKLRTEHPVFRRRHFFQGRRIRGSELEDLMWFRPDGQTMTESDWNAASTRAFAMRLGGDAMLEWDEQGRRVVDATLLLLFNASPEPVEFTVPRSAPEVVWRLVLSTSHPELEEGAFHVNGGEQIHTEGRSVLVLERVEGKE